MTTTRRFALPSFALAALAGALTGCSDDEVTTPSDAAPPACYDRAQMSSDDICTLLGDACARPAGAPPALSEAVTVVPDAAAMPDGVVSQTSHNNLDVVWHRGRLFFAFRTAPSHFASPDVFLYVVSTTDQKTWQLETSIHLEKDLREPRFLALGDELFLYFARLGEVTFTFKPEAMMMTRQLDGCRWSEPADLSPTGRPTFIPWRTQTIDGVGYLIGYEGGEEIYDVSMGDIGVHLFTTTDGVTFAPAFGADSRVLEGGGSETDWTFLADGSLVAVSRNEAGDADGFGMKICTAPADDLGTWTCSSDPKKYDSPLVFRHRDTVYLIGRRQVANDGNYDLGMDQLSQAEQLTAYQSEYWNTPKRCALWTIDPGTRTVDFVMDLPSNGDTCFASAVPLNDDQVLVYNYTSPLDDPDLPWNDGQFGPTSIYRTTLTLP